METDISMKVDGPDGNSEKNQLNDENSNIFHAIADVFQKAQSTYVGHRRHVAVLKKIQKKANAQGHGEEFIYWFNKLVSKVLPLKKNKVIGDRIIKLVAAFVASLDRDLENIKQQDSDKAMKQSDGLTQEAFNQFVNRFIRHILRGVESKDRNVRLRSLQILAVLMDNIREIDEELYDLIMWSLNKRVYDKEANVRIQAVFCLTKFQDESMSNNSNDNKKNKDEIVLDNATHKLMTIIQNDPSAEVRRASLLNLVNNKLTRAHILERSRDVNQINRRLIYSRVLKSMGMTCFDVDTRIMNQLLKWGLEDREESVRSACARLISFDWLNWLKGDLIELIERLNVIKSDIADKVMEIIFNTRPDIISKVKFPEEIWTDFTVEIAFLSKCFYLHCANNNLVDIIEQNYPEGTKLAEYLTSYLRNRYDIQETQLSKLEKMHLDFIIEQLLVIATKYDYSDEIGRRHMLTVIRNMLSLVDLSESLIKIGLEVLKILSINERDFVSMSIEIINDIRDDDIDLQEKSEHKGNPNKEYDSDDEDDDNIENFKNAVEDLVDGKNSAIEEGINVKHAEREATPETMIRCLTRSCNLLQLVENPLEQNVLITSLIDTLITPAVRNSDQKIRVIGIRNLGLCCLLDRQLAAENMYILGMCVSKGQEELKEVALQAIVDIFSVFGLSVVDGENMVDSLSLHKIFYKVLKNGSLPNCQVIAAEGLCKLYLADIFTDDDLFETLVLSYFTPQNSSNERLIQAFAFCIPVYCYSHPAHQQRMGRIAADVLLRLCIIWDDIQTNDDPESELQKMLKPNILFQQFIDWTDSRKLISSSSRFHNQDHYNVQLDFLLDVLKVFPKFEKKEIKKLLLINVNAVYISVEQDLARLQEILTYVEDIIENETLDYMSSNSLSKFKNTLIETITTLREDGKQTEVGSNSDEEFSQVLDSTYNKSDIDSIAEGDMDDDSAVDLKSKVESPVDESALKKRTIDDVEIENESNIEEISSTLLKSENLKNVSFILPEDNESDSMSVDDKLYIDD
ncbi:hypothetical protein TPHA_0D02160 [Tetrapisispora phaffii CBS 4417]|uniref:Nuclear condensin complex subunit 3 C-terminal domain-containing protein n=1 Tax=Tetrapisispora phaffii (strain ATCC 24235 / CBS 4417 / NBRC 1672 / NRRL Y-8282 / UCD 70-5) TaxID=1071381 RepID=G8BSN3_TETPH|nr:hypothetical protein TPHA_0D02160 [Tetrapisispora phaffii CBS 4417]CCE62854.1 hypothetical protein TPHA_0D02160 [Tetrapisispora phaffii CBS 4417]